MAAAVQREQVRLLLALRLARGMVVAAVVLLLLRVDPCPVLACWLLLLLLGRRR